MSRVSIAGARKAYGAHEVLHGISLDIEEGEFIALVGPSGCGKTTLLRMIAGLEETTGGEIRIGGRVVNDLPPSERDIAMVFQTYALYPHMTVAENMGFALRLAGVPKPQRRAQVEEAAAVLGLTPLLDRLPRQLSGGQRQRVAMGRAMVRNPAVYLFDEPLSNLDAKLRVQMRSEIKQTQARLGTTTVYVTHDQVEAMTMADRIVVLNKGEVAQVGSPLELYDHPANLFVAGFIGSPEMNLFRGAIRAGDFVTEAGEAFGLDGLGPEGPVVLGLRPEDLIPGPTGLPARVLTVEPTGAETLILASASGQDITLSTRERLGVGPGDLLHLTPRPGSLHLFDARSGVRR
jgi:multiple sugar transport system ATP-binding protein